MRASIRWSLLLFSFIAVVAVTVVFLGVSARGEREAYSKRYAEFLTDVSVSEAALLNASLDSLSRRIQQVKSSPQISASYGEYEAAAGSGNTDDKVKSFAETLLLALDDNANPSLINITLCDKNGATILTCKKTEESAIDSRGIAGGKYADDVFYYTPTGGLMCKTPYGGQSLVFTFSTGFISRFFAVSSRIESGGKGDMVIVDPTGVAVTTNGTPRSFSSPEFVALSGIKADYRGGFNFQNSYDSFVGGVSAPLDYAGWRVFVYFDSGDASVYWATSALSEYIAAIVAMLFCLFAVIFMFYYATPIVALSKIGNTKFHKQYFSRIRDTMFSEYAAFSDTITELADDIGYEKDRFAAMAENTDNIVFNWDLAADDIQFKGGFNKKFSYRAHTNNFNDCFFVKCKVHPDDEERYYKDLDLLKRNELISGEYRFKDCYGEYSWFIVRTVSIDGRVFGEEDKRHNILGVMIDIDRARKNASILSIRASFDSLTELYNRESVYQIISNEIELVSLRKSEIAIFFIDVDNFKYYNDNFSHATGNQVLGFIAQTLSDVCDNGDIGFAGRFGGDEFIVCIRNSRENDPETIIKKIMGRLSDGFVCDMGAKLTIGVSVGIARVRDSSQTIDKVIEASDVAMYEIKKNGKGSYAFIQLES
ncbi:hypothetical protein FACS1894133_2650 [Clostridia bacterium]|nr:hypothetical protein FACS1894133_2650 [Clostridia bacterium]